MANTETEILINDFSHYYAAFISQLPQIIIGLILFLLFYFISGPLSRNLIKPLKYAQTSALIKEVTRRIISAIVILFGFYLFLRMAGLSDFAVALLSGTGVAGIIIGFAFKDIAENFLSSILLSIQKPFRLGDVIEVNGHLGVAKQVTARATTLVDFDGNHIQIPNSSVYKNTIRNFTANPKSRGSFVIGIGYDADAGYAQDLGLAVLKQMDAILEDPEPQILVDELASSTMNLKVYFWTNTHKYSLLKVASLAMKNLVAKFEASSISMPDDAREVIFPQGINLKRTKPSQAEKESKADERNSQKITTTPVTLPIDNDDDLESDDDDIRKQADLARNPEQGSNIL